MQLDKLFSIEKKDLKVIFHGDKFVLPIEMRNKIDEYWNLLIKNGEKLFRGEVFTVSNIKEINNEIIISVDLSDYAHYLYSRRIGVPEKYACKNLHTSCLIETFDSIFIFGKMGKNTSLFGNIQCVGGGLDNDDIQGDTVDLVHNIKKELAEEVGINIDDNNLVEEFNIRYLKYNPDVYSIAAIFILKLKINAQEFKDSYAKFENQLKSEGIMPEFEKIIFLPKNKLELDDFYKKEKEFLDHYMMPLLKREMSD